MADEEKDEDESSSYPRVYGPKDWQILTHQTLPAMPGGSVPCAAIKEDATPCLNRAVKGTPFCRSHGGTTMSVQDQARMRIDAVRTELFELLCGAAKEAADTYVTIMRSGKRDVDRLKAADRVLELLGFRDDIANLPAEDANASSDIDDQLKTLLKTATAERLAQAIEVTTSEVVKSDDDAAA